MATLTVQPLSMASTGTTPTTQELSAADVFPATASERYVLVITGATAGEITVTLDDPNSAGPANAKAFNPDVDLVVPQGEVRVFKLEGASRFRDDSGNVNLTTSGTPAGSNVNIYPV